MKAVTVAPRTAGSVRLEGIPEPDAALGSVVVEALAAGRLLRLDSLGVTGPPCEPCRGYAADG
jgi:hypothetical protein